VDVHHPPCGDLSGDALDDLVVAVVADDAHVRDRVGEVADLTVCHLELLEVRGQAIVRAREVDNRVDARVDQ